MNEWSFFCAEWLNPWWQHSRWLAFQVEAEWWVKFFCAKWLNSRWQNSRWLPSSSWVRINEWILFCAKWLNQRWQNSRCLPSSSWVRINDFKSEWINWSQSFEQNGWIQEGRIQHGRIQDGCHHQVELEWMSEVFLYKCWEPILVSVSEFERKN